MEKIKEDIISALQVINRPGTYELSKWLQESDYFIAPSSTNFHCNYEGGLAEHSWNVFDLLVKKNEQFNLMYEYDTLAICGLLHDLCKVNFYKLVAEEPTEPQMKYLMGLCKGKLPKVDGMLHKDYVSKLIGYYKNGGEMPVYTKGGYQIDDQLPLGHGEKSVIMAQRFIQLTDIEMLAIRWHIIAFDPGIHFNYPSGFAFRSAVEKCRLVTILATADMEASNLLEEKR